MLASFSLQEFLELRCIFFCINYHILKSQMEITCAFSMHKIVYLVYSPDDISHMFSTLFTCVYTQYLSAWIVKYFHFSFSCLFLSWESQSYTFNERYEGLLAALMNVVFFWNVTQCGLVCREQTLWRSVPSPSGVLVPWGWNLYTSYFKPSEC